MKTKVKKEKSDAVSVRPPLAIPLKPKSKKLKKKKRKLNIEEVEEEVEFQSYQRVPSALPAPFKSKKDSPKIPGIRRQAQTEDVEHNFMIVPWGSAAEWNEVCLDFHSTNYDQVIARIGVWQRRVPALPVGVEATLFLLEAIVYDRKFLFRTGNGQEGLYTEDQARSLYSLAVIRYLNHVSHLAAQSLGESSTRPTRELAALVDTPEWIVSLRNEISHGSTAPSIEILRIAGTFILEWLKVKYWKLPEESNDATKNDDSNDLLVIAGQDVDDDAVLVEIDQLLAAYTAARIYKLRHIYSIRDEDIVRHLRCDSFQVKTKTAMTALRKKLKGYLQRHPSVFYTVFSQAIIPTPEFYDNFETILKKNKDDSLEQDEYVFEKFYGIWLPVMKMLQAKGKLLSILNNLCEVIVNPENEKVWKISAQWIEKILEIIESSGKKYSNALTKLLGVLVKHPNNEMLIFLERLFRLTEPRIGFEAVHKLSLLVSIALEDKGESKKRRRQQFRQTLFTVDDIENNGDGAKNSDTQTTRISDASTKWTIDHRGEDFWRNIPVGAVI